MQNQLFFDLINLFDQMVQSGAGVSPYAVLGFMVVSSMSVFAIR